MATKLPGPLATSRIESRRSPSGSRASISSYSAIVRPKNATDRSWVIVDDAVIQKLTSALTPAISAGAADRSVGTTYCTSGVMRTAGVSA